MKGKPAEYIGSARPYHPQLFVDEFWMSDDQLIKLNATGNGFHAAISFDLMSSGEARDRSTDRTMQSEEQSDLVALNYLVVACPELSFGRMP